MKQCNRGLLLACLFAVLMGCATHRIDWERRVGRYAYDEAVLEMGPPDKSAKLTDGTMVAEWLTTRGRVTGGFYDYNRGGMWLAGESSTPDIYIRLTFNPKGQLSAWKRVIK